MSAAWLQLSQSYVRGSQLCLMAYLAFSTNSTPGMLLYHNFDGWLSVHAS